MKDRRRFHAIQRQYGMVSIAKTDRDMMLGYCPTQPLPIKTIEKLRELGEVLRKIHTRLEREGYVIIENKLYSPTGELLYENKSYTNKHY